MLNEVIRKIDKRMQGRNGTDAEIQSENKLPKTQ